MLLSLNYFIGSIYAGMLWNLRDITELLYVNLIGVLKKKSILLLCGLLRAGAGQNMNVVGGSGTR